MISAKPNLVILAGSNGAGKTTIAEFLSSNESIKRFMNADLIASGISIKDHGNREIEAGRVMLRKLHQAIDKGEDVAFETTMSGRSWIKTIDRAHRAGYEVTICYVVLKSPALAKERVVLRVAHGGHSIPPEVVERRYKRSLNLFFSLYSELVDNWYLFDNSADSALLVASKEGEELSVFNYERYTNYKDAINIRP